MKTAQTFTTFLYDDDNQQLADMLSKFKVSKTYAVEQMNLEGLNNSLKDFTEFVVKVEVDTKYRKKKTDSFQSLKEFWTLDRMFTTSCPHWQRTAVNVSVLVRIRGDERPDATQSCLVSWNTWYDNKFKNQAEGLANNMLNYGYDETASKVRAEWADHCVSDNKVDQNALLNGFGIVKALSNHLEQANAQETKEILDIFSKVKV